MEYGKWQQLSIFLVLIAVHGSNMNNIAVNKPARQSSLGPRSQTPDGFAWKAVDGNTNGFFNKGSCSHNDAIYENGTEWWEVDLEQLYNVTEIIVYSRTDTCCLSWLDDYILYSGVNCEIGICYSECYRYNKTLETVKVNRIPEGCIAQHIRLSVIHKSLVLCEVEIFGELIPIVSSTLLPSSEISSDDQGLIVSTSEQPMQTSTETNSLSTNVNSSAHTGIESSSTDSFEMTPYTSYLEYMDVDPTFSSLGSTISSFQNQIISSSTYLNELNSETEGLSSSSSLQILSLSQDTTVTTDLIVESSWDITSPTIPISTVMTLSSTSYSEIISSTQNIQLSSVEVTPSSTIEISTTDRSNCPCLCSQLTQIGIQEKLKFIIDSLSLPKDNLSSFRRKKRTEDDNRLSAVVTGYTGAAILCCVFGFLVSGDVLALLRYIVSVFRKSNQNQNVANKLLT